MQLCMIIFSPISGWISQGGKGKLRKEKQLSRYPLVIHTHAVNTDQNNIFNCQKKMKRATVRDRHRASDTETICPDL